MKSQGFDPAKLRHAGRSSRGGLNPEDIGLVLADGEDNVSGVLIAEEPAPMVGVEGTLESAIDEGVAFKVVAIAGTSEVAERTPGPLRRRLLQPVSVTDPEARRKRSYTLTADLHDRIHVYERRYLAEHRERLARGAFLCDALARLPSNDDAAEELLDAAEGWDSRLLVRPVNAAVPEEIHLALTDLSYRRQRRVSLNRLATELVHRYLGGVEAGEIVPPR